MDPIQAQLHSSDQVCDARAEHDQQSRSPVPTCPRCDIPPSHSESSDAHSKMCEQEIIQIQPLHNDLTAKVQEKDKYIVDTSQEAIEIVVNWYQRLINDLIESQTEIVDAIERERDRARDELGQLSKNQQPPANDQSTEFIAKLSNYQITKEVYLPDSRTFRPRYKISYEFKKPTPIEEDWDIETNETTNIPLPSRLTLSTTQTAPPAVSNTPPTFVSPNDDEDETDVNFQWHEEPHEEPAGSSEYLLDPRSYHRGSSRHFPLNVHLVASDGNDLLCYSRQSKQLIFIGDGNFNTVILKWYHGHIIQLLWCDSLQSYVTITDENHYEIYTIESTYTVRLKITLRTRLPKQNIDIVSDRIHLRAHDSHVFIYYERTDGRKRLRLLNSTFECVRSYAIDRCFQTEEHRRARDNGSVIGLGVNQDHVVLFVRSTVDTGLSEQAAADVEDVRLLVFNTATMAFVRRIILPPAHFQPPFIVHFINISSFFIIDQTQHILRFYNHEKQIGQIKLLSPRSSLTSATTTASSSHPDMPYSSMILMNDGSLLLSNNTEDLVQLLLVDHARDADDW